MKLIEVKDQTVVVEFNFNQEEIKNAINTVYNDNKSYFNVAGFRKGKVPFSVVKKQYGIEMFLSDAAQELLEGALEELANDTKFVEENKVALNVTPRMVIKDLTEENITIVCDLIQTATVELKEYKGIEAKKESVKVTEKEITEEIEKELKKNSRLEAKDQKAENGNTLNINFEGFVNDVAFEGGKGENFDLELGSGTFIPGFEEQLVGTKAGENKDVVVTFPTEYHAANLAGKEAVFKVLVNEVKVSITPEVDDEFAKDLGFDNLEEYKDSIKTDLKTKKQAEAENNFKTAVLDKLLELNTVTVHEREVDAAVNERINQMNEQYRMYGLSLEQILQMSGKTVEEFKREQKTVTENNLKLSYILAEVAKKEKLEATEEEINEKLIEQLKMSHNEEMDEEHLNRHLTEIKEMDHVIRATKNLIIDQKAQDFIFENVKK